MEKSYFHQFIDDLDKIAKNYRVKHDLASASLDTAKQKNDRVRADRTTSEDKKLIAAATYREAEREYKKAMQEIEAGAEREIKALRKSFEQYMAEFFTAKPEKIDQNAVSLMASGIMTAADLTALANQHANNPTMLRLISAHANKINEGKSVGQIDHLASALCGCITDFCGTKERLQLFDTAARVVQWSLDKSGGRAGTFQDKWDTEFYPGIKTQMAGMESFAVGEV